MGKTFRRDDDRSKKIFKKLPNKLKKKPAKHIGRPTISIDDKFDKQIVDSSDD